MNKHQPPRDRWDEEKDGRTTSGEPILSTHLRDMVDALLDLVAEEDPGQEYHLVVSEFWDAEDVPVERDRIFRTVDGKVGYYRGNAYRDTLIDRVSCKPWLVVASAIEGGRVYYADLRTGQIGDTLPPDAIVSS